MRTVVTRIRLNDEADIRMPGASHNGRSGQVAMNTTQKTFVVKLIIYLTKEEKASGN